MQNGGYRLVVSELGFHKLVIFQKSYFPSKDRKMKNNLIKYHHFTKYGTF